MSDKEKNSKTKAIALALAVSVAMVNPILLSGCEVKNPYSVVDEDEMKKNQDQNSTVIYGGGSLSPFIFTNATTNNMFNQQAVVNKSSGTGWTGGGWKTWTSSSSGDYSGVHASGFSS